MDLNKWCICYCQDDHKLFVKFVEMFQMVAKQFGQNMQEPRQFAMQGIQKREWIQVLGQLDPSV